MTLPKYQYRPIDLSTDAIRLIRLVKGSYASSIRCELFQSYLDRSVGVPYEALSYAWGDTSAETTCLEVINGDFTTSHYLEIYPNLYEILRHLRYLNEDRILWIDAICIDQRKTHTAVQERSHQVEQMRLVYKNADRVVAWLGGLDQDMAELLHMASELDENISLRSTQMAGISIWKDQFQEVVRLQALESQGHFLDEKGMRSAMSRTLHKAWFRRVWIIQEVASATTGSIIGAQKEFTISAPMRTFALLPSILESEHSHHIQAILDVMPRAGQRREGWWNQDHDLITLLTKFSSSECSEPRDSVYALLGIWSDVRVKTILRPNYELPLEVVLRNTLSYLLFSEVLDPGIYKLPAIAMWNQPPDFPHLTKRALLWALQNESENVALRLLDLEGKNWKHDFRISFAELSLILRKNRVLSTAEQLGKGFGARILMSLAMKRNDFEDIGLDLLKGYLDLDTDASILAEMLFLSISERKLVFAQHLLESRAVDVKAFHPSWNDAVCTALRTKNTAMVQMLLQIKDTHIDFKEAVRYFSAGRGPLYLAVELGMSDAVDLLLHHKSFDPAVSNTYGIERILCSAAKQGNIQTFESIWNRQNISVDANCECGKQALLGVAAAQANGLSIVKLILTGRHGIVDINRLSSAAIPEVQGKLGGFETIMMTPLKIAALKGHEDIVRYLVDTQKRLDLETGHEDMYGTALWAATHRNHAGIVEVLLRHGANFEGKGYGLSGSKLEQRVWSWVEENQRCTDNSRKIGYLSPFREFIDSRERRIQERSNGTTPLEEAKSLGFHSIFEILQKYGA